MSDDSTRRRLLSGIGTGVAVGLAGCLGGGGGGDGGSGDGGDGDGGTDTPMDTATDTPTDEPTASASLRVAHLSPNAPNVDVLVDGSAVLEDVAYGTVSSYLEAPAGTRTVEITAAGDPDASVFEGDVTVESGRAYTVAAAGEVGEAADRSFAPLVLEDDNSDPGGDTARLRVVHASPDAPAVDVTVNATGDVLFDGVAFGESGYVEVPADDYTVQIRGDTDANDGEVVADFDVSLEGGRVYTAFAQGYLTPDDEPADVNFVLNVVPDTGGMAG